MLSWNLCDALLRMQPEQNAGQLELSTTWAVDPRMLPPLETDTPSRIAINSEYIPEIKRTAQILRPRSASNREEMLIGIVKILSGVVGPDGRRSGEVQFSLLLPDSDPLRVRANLDPEQYADAVRARESGRGYVRLHGVLHRGPAERPHRSTTRPASPRRPSHQPSSGHRLSPALAARAGYALPTMPASPARPITTIAPASSPMRDYKHFSDPEKCLSPCNSDDTVADLRPVPWRSHVPLEFTDAPWSPGFVPSRRLVPRPGVRPAGVTRNTRSRTDRPAQLGDLRSAM